MIGAVLFLKIDIKGVEVLVVNIYAPNEDDAEFYERLFTDIASFNVTNNIIAGDYNLVLNVDIDKSGGNAKTNSKAQVCVKRYMEALDLCDIWRVRNANLKEYTWRRRRPSLIQCRLDFFIISDSLVNMVSGITIGNSFMSDHSLVSMKLKLNNIRRGNGYWKVNCALLQDINYVGKTRGPQSRPDSECISPNCTIIFYVLQGQSSMKFHI